MDLQQENASSYIQFYVRHKFLPCSSFALVFYQFHFCAPLLTALSKNNDLLLNSIIRYASQVKDAKSAEPGGEPDGCSN